MAVAHIERCASRDDVSIFTHRVDESQAGKIFWVMSKPVGAYAQKTAVFSREKTCVKSRKKLTKGKEAGKTVEERELKREKNNGGLEGTPSVYYVLFTSLGPTSTDLMMEVAGFLRRLVSTTYTELQLRRKRIVNTAV